MWLNSCTAKGSWMTCIHLELLAELSELAVELGTEEVVSFELVVVFPGDVELPVGQPAVAAGVAAKAAVLGVH